MNFLNPTHRILAALVFGGMSSEFIYFVFMTFTTVGIDNVYASFFLKGKFLYMTSTLRMSDVVNIMNKCFLCSLFFRFLSLSLSLSLFRPAVLILILIVLFIALLYYPFFACMDAPISLVGYCMGSLYCDL